MKRYEVSASQWSEIEGSLPGRPGSVGVTARDNRVFVNGVLWVLRSGAHWEDLPAAHGPRIYLAAQQVERATE